MVLTVQHTSIIVLTVQHTSDSWF